MDIKWKDGNGNILNANKNRVAYLEKDTNIKTVIKNEEIKKVVIVDGMINIFKDFDHDLALTIIIPKGNKKNAVKIFNEYDKTGQMFNSGKGNAFTGVFLDAFIDITVTLTNPISIFLIVPIVLLIAFLTIRAILEGIFGGAGKYISYMILLAYPIYGVTRYVLTLNKRKKLKEI